MSSGSRQGPPKHQNKFAWKPIGGQKINPMEFAGTGVCLRCKGHIDWKQKYGKYKFLSEPAKCQRCSERNVRQAYHNLCHGSSFSNCSCVIELGTLPLLKFISGSCFKDCP